MEKNKAAQKEFLISLKLIFFSFSKTIKKLPKISKNKEKIFKILISRASGKAK